MTVAMCVYVCVRSIFWYVYISLGESIHSGVLVPTWISQATDNYVEGN
jgi:hypothetical protein